MIGLSSVLLDEKTGDRYMLISVWNQVAVSVVRIPEGMTDIDFGRRFFHDPQPSDRYHAALGARAHVVLNAHESTH